jgi:hypothetical protein
MKNPIDQAMRKFIDRKFIVPLIWAFGSAAIATGGEAAVELQQGGNQIFAWQHEPLSAPIGGDKFAASAFIHPLRTPSGFECTTIQPSDHLHHLGLWWPWKFIEVEGKKFNCWEIQEGQGAHVARSVKNLSNKPDQAEWELINETVVKKPGASPMAVIHETVRLGVTLRTDATVLDLSLRQKAVGSPVEIVEYRYSGFSWRGPSFWNKDNSTMTTSGGKGRDEANGSPARWVVLSGATPSGGMASLLMMSAAEKLAGSPEKVRVWDSNAHHGAPFVNFNPVMEKPLTLDDAHPAVSSRKYRVIAADRVIDPASAEAEWQRWMEN